MSAAGVRHLRRFGQSGYRCSQPGWVPAVVYARTVDERPPPDPTKLLVAWMEWERGETPPGRVLSNLKIAGMREFLEASAEAQADLAASADSSY